MKKPIKIEHFFFSDGIIQSFQVGDNEAELIFEDSSESKILFHFYDAGEINEQYEIGTSVYASHLEKVDGQMRLRLLDDDLKEMLTITFRTYLIEFL